MSQSKANKKRLYNELDGVDYSYKLAGFSNSFVEDILQRGVAEGEPEKAEVFMQSIYNFESKKNSKKSV
jgi:hypothetical protein